MVDKHLLDLVFERANEISRMLEYEEYEEADKKDGLALLEALFESIPELQHLSSQPEPWLVDLLAKAWIIECDIYEDFLPYDENEKLSISDLEKFVSGFDFEPA